MTRYLCISVTLLDPFFHGKCDRGEPEWPPSPLRLFQALLRGTRTGCRSLQWSPAKAEAFRLLEQCAPPLIVAPDVHRLRSYTLFIPNNDSDKEFDRQNRLTSKVAHPHQLPDELADRRIHYLWRISNQESSMTEGHAELLCFEARNLLALGWGIDQAVADGRILTESQTRDLSGIRWVCKTGRRQGDVIRRVPKEGTLDDLEQVHENFLNSVEGRQYYPWLKPSVFNRVLYVSPNTVQGRTYRVFELRNTDGSRFRYSHRRLIHVAGMVRHLAIEAMRKDPPRGVDDDWVETFVAGHAPFRARDHRQFSYLPLPSVGNEHTDPGVRRVMIAAPVGDDAWLDHLARRLAGESLKPVHGNEFFTPDPPILVPVRNDNVAKFYTRPSRVWHSFTPAILPGHDDHKPEKTRKLIQKALAQSGIDQPCEFDWSPYSHFRKSFSAHKYGKDNRPAGYFRPDHLQSQTAVHLTIRFNEGVKVPGPIVIGAGRHCGFGLMAVPLNEN